MFGSRTKEQVENGNSSIVGTDLNPNNKSCVAISKCVYDEFPANET